MEQEEVVRFDHHLQAVHQLWLVALELGKKLHEGTIKIMNRVEVICVPW